MSQKKNLLYHLKPLTMRSLLPISLEFKFETLFISSKSNSSTGYVFLCEKEQTKIGFGLKGVLNAERERGREREAVVYHEDYNGEGSNTSNEDLLVMVTTVLELPVGHS